MRTPLTATGGLIELKEEDGESYWVTPDLWPHLADEPTFGRRLVVTAITRQGVLFLWGLRLPGPDAKAAPWVEIPLEAARAAETKWVKMFLDQSQRQHRIKVATGLADETAWPESRSRNFSGWHSRIGSLQPSTIRFFASCAGQA